MLRLTREVSHMLSSHLGRRAFLPNLLYLRVTAAYLLNGLYKHL